MESEEEFYRKFDILMQESGVEATAALLCAEMPVAIPVPKDFSRFGTETGGLASRMASRFEEDFGKEAESILACASHMFSYAKMHGAFLMQKLIDNDVYIDNVENRQKCMPDEYGKRNGRTETLVEGYTPGLFRSEIYNALTTRFQAPIPNRYVAMECMTILWFAEANALFAASDIPKGIDVLAEAVTCWQRKFSKVMREDLDDDKVEITEDIAALVRSETARKASYAAHAETRSLKEEVKTYWLGNISPGVGNDDAASLLIGRFPLSFRVLSKYVSEFKRSLPSPRPA
ncbi:hypothetical protein [Massilia sp. CCM 8734]|uniref:hypothetical protein n=1 Tax=Massilia sp. CCM 8734 TaxID=2609283 RepID=UPI00141DA147|nr:hypothetical protein [Massilia sp. CCM 8734]NIA00087.1 hypothetical protein [Massilia sp. CCM 8734]